MIKVDDTVKRETLYIAKIVFVLSLLMEAVFLVFKQWNYTVLLGNLLSMAVAVLNFFLMGITVQKAVGKEEKDAANMMKVSQRLRFLMILAAMGVGIAFDCFNIIAVILPQFFPRIAIAIRPLIDKTRKGDGDIE